VRYGLQGSNPLTKHLQKFRDAQSGHHPEVWKNTVILTALKSNTSYHISDVPCLTKVGGSITLAITIIYNNSAMPLTVQKSAAIKITKCNVSEALLPKVVLVAAQDCFYCCLSPKIPLAKPRCSSLHHCYYVVCPH